MISLGLRGLAMGFRPFLHGASVQGLGLGRPLEKEDTKANTLDLF